MESNRKNSSRVAAIAMLALVAVAAGAWQGTGKQLAKNQGTANTNARALATAVQARGVTLGHYDNNLSSYAREFGGKIPINPCTGTRTGYTMTIKGKTAAVAAMQGNKCGKWTPMVYSLSLNGYPPATVGPLTKKRNAANTNARALATAVQAEAITKDKYDAKLADYATDLGGTIPINPCTGTTTGYTIVVKGKTATVAAQKGKLCGEWTPMTFHLTL